MLYPDDPHALQCGAAGDDGGVRLVAEDEHLPAGAVVLPRSLSHDTVVDRTRACAASLIPRAEAV